MTLDFELNKWPCFIDQLLLNVLWGWGVIIVQRLSKSSSQTSIEKFVTQPPGLDTAGLVERAMRAD